MPRIPCPHEYSWWARDTTQKTRKGEKAPERLSRASDDRMPSSRSRSFARKYRLVRSSEIRALIRSRTARRQADRYFKVTSMKTTLGRPRLCLGVPRRCVRRAVDRNRAKRIIRDSFRRCRQRLPSRDILLMARYPVHTVEAHTLRASLTRLWKRLQ